MSKLLVSSEQLKSIILILMKKNSNEYRDRDQKIKVLKLYALYKSAKNYEQEHKRLWVTEKFTEEQRQAVGAHIRLLPQLRVSDPDFFFRLMRMSPETFDKLLAYIGPKIAPAKGVRQPIFEKERLELVLHYLATGSFMYVAGLQFRISEAATHNFVCLVCDAIWDVLHPIVFEEPSEEMWRRSAEEFEILWDFPNCVGAIDGKLVQIECPAGSGLNYRDYKGHYSLNLMAISGAKQDFTMCDIGAPGRHSDGGVFAHSEMGKRFASDSMHVPSKQKITNSEEEFPFVLVGDEAFALSSYMMRPYPRRFELDLAKRVFNYRLSRARRIVETSFGILSAVWRIFKAPLRTNLDTSVKIIKACVCLHNFILKLEPRRQRKRIIDMGKTPDASDNCFTDLPGADQCEVIPASGPARERENFANYFMTSGAVDFQWAKAIYGEF